MQTLNEFAHNAPIVTFILSLPVSCLFINIIIKAVIEIMKWVD